jgi:23S rRNA (cytosine1962-C5)-methyltransferase
MNEVRVNRKAAGRVASGHPWIFSSDITDRDGAQPGEAVRVADAHGRTLGTAHYSSTSQIALRMLSAKPRRLAAISTCAGCGPPKAHRRRVVHHSSAYRVVHGEADLLPALVVDRYGDYLVVQTLDQGMDAAKPLIVSCLEEIFSRWASSRATTLRCAPRKRCRSKPRCWRATIPEAVAVEMNGLKLQRRPAARPEDRHLSRPARELPRRGSLRAAARRSIVSRRRAASRCTWRRIAKAWKRWTARRPRWTARANAEANGIANIEFRQADVFDLLAGYASARRQFSLVVLDPPAFAKSRRSLDGAATGYKEINLRALRLLAPGGILVTCSCSHHVSEAMLLELVAKLRSTPAAPARAGAPHAEPGSPDPAHRAGDALLEVPDSGSGVI